MSSKRAQALGRAQPEIGRIHSKLDRSRPKFGRSPPKLGQSQSKLFEPRKPAPSRRVRQRHSRHCLWRAAVQSACVNEAELFLRVQANTWPPLGVRLVEEPLDGGGGVKRGVKRGQRPPLDRPSRRVLEAMLLIGPPGQTLFPLRMCGPYQHTAVVCAPCRRAAPQACSAWIKRRGAPSRAHPRIARVFARPGVRAAPLRGGGEADWTLLYAPPPTRRRQRQRPAVAVGPRARATAAVAATARRRYRRRGPDRPSPQLAWPRVAPAPARCVLGGPGTAGRTNTRAAPARVSARWHETVVAASTAHAAAGVDVPRQVQAAFCVPFCVRFVQCAMEFIGGIRPRRGKDTARRPTAESWTDACPDRVWLRASVGGDASRAASEGAVGPRLAPPLTSRLWGRQKPDGRGAMQAAPSATKPLLARSLASICAICMVGVGPRGGDGVTIIPPPIKVSSSNGGGLGRYIN